MKNIRKETITVELKNVCVIGAGVMGRQIALNAAAAGYQVWLCDSFPDALAPAKAWAKSFLDKSVQKEKMTREKADEALSRMECTSDVDAAIADADLIIEAIIEKEDIKRALFEKINVTAPAETIVASNSSFMPSSKFADVFKDPSRLANLHYFNPAMLMKLVEIVRGPHTSDQTVEILKQFVGSIGKTYIIVNKEIEGFVVNRLLRAVQNEAFYLLDNGIASFQDIDLGAEKGLNYPMGPFRLNDLTGLDITYLSRMEKYGKTNDPADAPPKALAERYEKGDFGKKTGRGWYDYSK